MRPKCPKFEANFGLFKFKRPHINKFILPKLTEFGVSEKIINSICIDNPRRFFEGRSNLSFSPTKIISVNLIAGVFLVEYTGAHVARSWPHPIFIVKQLTIQ
jgi:hypothetical protein